ncbi:MAG: glycoside hydrolase family 16 protein [Bacteroidaceae bacterium]|nr:glycoside hydrolase family 16 protein [Bacteroidaceae bacterium]
MFGQTTQEGWKLIWADEFDTDGEPAPHWNYEHGFVRNHELQWYQPQNARVVDGVLQITGRLETVENTRFDASSNDWRRNRREARYTSACITTAKSFHFRYGRLEVRARIPVAEGAWPAIWTLGNQWGWPACGEIDVMEFYRVPPTTMGVHHDDQSAATQRSLPIILANACWQGEHGGDKWNTCRVPYSHFTERDAEWASKFHTWRMDWTPDAIRLYLDDELLNDIHTSLAQNGGGPNHDVNPFANDIEGFGHYILLNLAIGSSGGTPDELAFPLLYEIDYVRVYQQE